MLTATGDPVKPTPPRLIVPPWDRHCPEWLALDRALPADHPARLLRRAVAGLDLDDALAGAGRGSPAYPPTLMLLIVLYELHDGVRSPRRWARDVRTRDELKWLGFGIAPSRSRLHAFRDRLGGRLDALHRRALAAATAAGMTPATRAAVDGTTIRAAGSRRRMLSGRALEGRLARLERAVAWDAVERVGPPQARPWWMAATPRGRAAQHRRYLAARARLHERVADNARRRSCKRRAPAAIVVSAAEPEAAIGRDKDGVYGPLYNVQVAYDVDSELVLSYGVFAQQNDAGTLGPMLERFAAWVGHRPAVVLADTAYANVIDAGLCAAAGAAFYAPCPADDRAADDRASAARASATGPRWLPKGRFAWDGAARAYRCPAGHAMPYASRRVDRHAGGHEVVREFYRCPAEHCRACPRVAACTPNPAAGRTVSRARGEEHVEALRARMATAEAQALYKLRRQTVERGFADLKEHRRLRRFACRGLARVRVELGLSVLAHNLWVLARQWARQEAPRAAG